MSRPRQPGPPTPPNPRRAMASRVTHSARPRAFAFLAASLILSLAFTSLPTSPADAADSRDAPGFATDAKPRGSHAIEEDPGVQPSSIATVPSPEADGGADGYVAVGLVVTIGAMTGAQQQAYAYDALGRRVRVEGASPATWTVSVVSGMETVFERDQAGVTTKYVYAAGMRVARIDCGNQIPAACTTRYYLGDHLGSTRKLVDAGVPPAVVYSAEYEPFGKPYNVQGAEGYRYTGEKHDDPTGLVYLRARQYDPELGRFVSADPLLGSLSTPQTQNRYAYVVNNPLTNIDPTGNYAIRQGKGWWEEDYGQAFDESMDIWRTRFESGWTLFKHGCSALMVSYNPCVGEEVEQAWKELSWANYRAWAGSEIMLVGGPDLLVPRLFPPTWRPLERPGGRPPETPGGLGAQIRDPYEAGVQARLLREGYGPQAIRYEPEGFKLPPDFELLGGPLAGPNGRVMLEVTSMGTGSKEAQIIHLATYRQQGYGVAFYYYGADRDFLRLLWEHGIPGLPMFRR